MAHYAMQLVVRRIVRGRVERHAGVALCWVLRRGASAALSVACVFSTGLLSLRF